MPFTVNDIILGGLVPFAVSLAVFFVVSWLFPRPIAERWAAALSLLTGLTVGYSLLSLGPLVPEAHWHWLPFCLAAATVVGSVGEATGVSFIERSLLVTVLAVAVAWLVVPDWEDLDPGRTTWICGLTACVLVVGSLIRPLESRRPGPVLPLVFWATATAASVILALSGSLRFAQIALAGAAALSAIACVALFQRDRTIARGLSVPFCVLIAGSLLIGHVNSFTEIPRSSYLLVPLAPVTLWLTTSGPMSRLTRFTRVMAMTLPVAVILGGALLLAVIAEGSGGGDY